MQSSSEAGDDAAKFGPLAAKQAMQSSSEAGDTAEPGPPACPGPGGIRHSSPLAPSALLSHHRHAPLPSLSPSPLALAVSHTIATCPCRLSHYRHVPLPSLTPTPRALAVSCTIPRALAVSHTIPTCPCRLSRPSPRALPAAAWSTRTCVGCLSESGLVRVACPSRLSESLVLVACPNR